MDNRIESFIKAQRSLTLCTTIKNIPACASCFYAYMTSSNSLVFKSARSTAHVSNALINPNIAGTVVADITKIGNVKGVQFVGNFIEPKEELLECARRIYYRKYPFAVTIPGELWLIELTYVKLTDNTLGFGKKIIWHKETR